MVHVKKCLSIDLETIGRIDVLQYFRVSDLLCNNILRAVPSAMQILYGFMITMIEAIAIFIIAFKNVVQLLTLNCYYLNSNCELTCCCICSYLRKSGDSTIAIGFLAVTAASWVAIAGYHVTMWTK
mmetsp:Transcript_10798/g.12383  ORF Transcript_10798/g.12383 Transcript_10798/m.12383 type:complete len:126 (+) Transcript_10798:863-1240(+)